MVHWQATLLDPHAGPEQTLAALAAVSLFDPT